MTDCSLAAINTNQESIRKTLLSLRNRLRSHVSGLVIKFCKFRNFPSREWLQIGSVETNIAYKYTFDENATRWCGGAVEGSSS
jgi:hypothetical protein